VLQSVNSRYHSISCLGFSFKGKPKNLDLHMLKPSKVLAVLCHKAMQVSFLRDYRRKLETPTSFHLHKDIPTDLPSRPQVKR
jgi:hypothetical protein